MRVKIDLEPGQTPYQAEEELFKAMSLHRDGGTHDEDKFQDPAIQHLADLMGQTQDAIYERMLFEIIEVLEQEPR